MSEETAGSIIPPDGFVAGFNTEATVNGQPFRSALDPLVMLAWHLVNEPPAQPFVTGLPGV